MDSTIPRGHLAIPRHESGRLKWGLPIVEPVIARRGLCVSNGAPKRSAHNTRWRRQQHTQKKSARRERCSSSASSSATPLGVWVLLTKAGFYLDVPYKQKDPAWIVTDEANFLP